MPIPQKKGDPVLFAQDESVRAETTAEVLRALKPAFKKDGSVTAGNAPPVNDGAAALVVMSAARAAALGLTPMARIVAQATSGLEPKMLLMTPVEASRKVAKKAGWNLQDVDLFELNEAFAVQAVAVIRELGIDAGAGQRQRRRRRPGPPDRRLRRARADDAALRARRIAAASAASPRSASAAATAWRWPSSGSDRPAGGRQGGAGSSARRSPSASS